MTDTGSEVILCPVDFSQIAANALRHAARLAACGGGRVVAAHAAWFEVPPYFTESRIAELERQTRESLAEATLALGRFVEQTLPEAAREVELAVVEGSPSTAILDLASQRHAGLIVMGTHGRTGINRWMLGSVAERVVRESRIPVLTTRMPPSTEFRQVLAAVNNTELSRKVLSQAADLASRCGANLGVVHVSEPHGEDLISDLCQWIPAGVRSGCNVRELLRHGDPAQQIVAVASETPCDLLVIGAPERGFFQGSVLSRTALRVIRQAPCPVLSIGGSLPA